MANLRETSVWEAGIYQLETSDPVMGGENGIDNKAPRQLANRTLWLKNELTRAINLINQNNTNLDNQKANKATQFTAGNGLTGGGDFSVNRTIALGTPSKITANSINTAVSNTHSHEIDKASTTVAGIVQLNDTLTSTANNQALTAAQGKVLNDTKLDKVSSAQITSAYKMVKYYDVARWGHYQASVAGCVAIKLPVFYTTMYSMRLTGFNYHTTSSWHAQIAGYQYSATQIINPTIVVHGDAPFDIVRFAIKDGVHYILLGDIDTAWSYPSITIDEVHTTFGSAHRWGEGYEFELLTDLSAYTVFSPKIYGTKLVKSSEKLATARTISISGAATGSYSFDGSKNASCVLTLANSGVVSGTYGNNITIPTFTVNEKGLITGVSNHAIRSASTTVSGIVQLNDTLTSTATNQALTAHQGKILNDTKVNKAGDTMTGALQMPTTVASPLNSTPFAISYGRLQSYAGIHINANTDNSNDEPVLITSGKGLSSNRNDGLAVGSNYLTWLGVAVATTNDVDTRLPKSGGVLTGGLYLHPSGLRSSGDTDTGIDFPRDGVIRTIVDSRERIHIQAGGNITLRTHEGASLAFQNDKNLVIYDERNQPVFATESTKNDIAGKVSKAGDTMTGHLAVSYQSDWVGMSVKNPTNQKNGFYDVNIGGITRGSFQITHAGNNAYNANINITTSGDNSERRVAGLVVSEGGLYAHAYGNLHEYFVKANGNQTINGIKNFTNETHFNSHNAIRLKPNGANRSVFFRFDGNTFYLLKTNANDPDGTWDNTRPLEWNVNTNQLWLRGNADTATKLQTARQIALTGAVTGNVNFDGSGNVSIATTLTKATVKDYNRTIHATAAGQTTNTMDLVGQVVVGADGRITQYFHLKHFRDFWFARDDNAVGTTNGSVAGYKIPITLWTAMPNKVLSVQAQTMRGSHATFSEQYTVEAIEQEVAWAIRNQGNNKNDVWIHLGRTHGGASEPIDLFVTVEGY